MASNENRLPKGPIFILKERKQHALDFAIPNTPSQQPIPVDEAEDEANWIAINARPNHSGDTDAELSANAQES